MANPTVKVDLVVNSGAFSKLVTQYKRVEIELLNLKILLEEIGLDDLQIALKEK